MLKCLSKDPRFWAIRERDSYWIATLLDPRYKGKMPKPFLPSQLCHLQKMLQRNLLTAFPESDRTPFHGQHASEKGVVEVSVAA